MLYLNTKIWRKGLSLGSNFRNIRAFWTIRVSCYFLIHAFQIKMIVFWKLPINTFPNRSIISIRFFSYSVESFAEGRTYEYWLNSYIFYFLIKNVFTCPYLSLLFHILHPLRTILHPFLGKVYLENRYKNIGDQLNLLFLKICSLTKTFSNLLVHSNRFLVAEGKLKFLQNIRISEYWP